MGILNITPDSFSDGGLHVSVDSALRRVEQFVMSGADIIDIGGESTRPGASPVSSDEEIARVVPIIQKIVARFDIPLSIDTFKAQTADEALKAGAVIVNDISGLRADPRMADLIASTDAGAVLMFNPAYESDQASTESRKSSPDDWAARMTSFLRRSVDLAVAAGIGRDRLMIDPGIGFAMTPEASIDFMRQSGSLRSLGHAILVGPSRKRFIGQILGGRPVEGRLMGTAASVCFAITAGADFVRVHDVTEIIDVVRVMDTLYREGEDQHWIRS